MTEKKAEISRQELETKPVVDLLASILSEVQKQVLSKTPPPLDGEVIRAIEQFRAIGAALALRPGPAVTLKAEPTNLPVGGGPAKLTWATTEAPVLIIDQGIGEVTPAAGGTIVVNLTATTTFTATAVNPCSSATAAVTVTVANVV